MREGARRVLRKRRPSARSSIDVCRRCRRPRHQPARRALLPIQCDAQRPRWPRARVRERCVRLTASRGAYEAIRCDTGESSFCGRPARRRRRCCSTMGTVSDRALTAWTCSTPRAAQLDPALSAWGLPRLFRSQISERARVILAAVGGASMRAVGDASQSPPPLAIIFNPRHGSAASEYATARWG